MTAPTDRPEFSPVPLDAPTEDRIGTAMLSMSAAAAVAVAWFAGLTFVVGKMTADSTIQSIEQVNPNAGYVNLLAYGVPMGLGITGLCAWLLLAPIPSTYRRGALAMVAALGGTSLAMAATFVVGFAVSRAAVVALVPVGILAALFLARRAKISAAT